MEIGRIDVFARTYKDVVLRNDPRFVGYPYRFTSGPIDCDLRLLGRLIGFDIRYFAKRDNAITERRVPQTKLNRLVVGDVPALRADRKSTRLNSSHLGI